MMNLTLGYIMGFVYTKLQLIVNILIYCLLNLVQSHPGLWGDFGHPTYGFPK